MTKGDKKKKGEHRVDDKKSWAVGKSKRFFDWKRRLRKSDELLKITEKRLKLGDNCPKVQTWKK